MELPSNLHDALEALQAARADVSALESLTAEHSALVAAFAAHKEKFSELEALLEATTADRAALAQSLDALKAEQATAAAQANAIIASVGVDPVAIQSEQVHATKSVSDLWAEYNSLPIEARNAFYAQHKAVLKLS